MSTLCPVGSRRQQGEVDGDEDDGEDGEMDGEDEDEDDGEDGEDEDGVPLLEGK